MHEATEEQEREERERERREAEVGSKRRAVAAFSPGSYHPPAHPHPSFAAAGTHAQSQTATTPTPSHHSTYVNGAPLPTHAQTQRPAPTLVIPSQQLQSQFAYPRSAGHAGWSPVDSVPPSFATQHAGTPQTYSSGSSSSGSGSATSARAYAGTSLATPLERFGAMSLSSGRRARRGSASASGRGWSRASGGRRSGSGRCRMRGRRRRARARGRAAG